MTNNPSEQSDLDSFESLASEYAQKVRRGESPDIEEFASRNDQLAARVQRLFPMLEMLEQHGSSGAWTEMELLAEHIVRVSNASQ